MRENLPAPEGLAGPFARAQPLGLARATDLCEGASAALHGWSVEPTTAGAARLASGHTSERTRVGLTTRFF
jgi:hypothetical protein